MVHILPTIYRIVEVGPYLNYPIYGSEVCEPYLNHPIYGSEYVNHI